MSVCSTEEWLEMQRDYHCRMAWCLSQSAQDYKNGDYWYVVEALPAYSDIRRSIPDVKVNGRKGDKIEDLVALAKKMFYEDYNDHREHSIIIKKIMCFENGWSMEEKELDRMIYD